MRIDLEVVVVVGLVSMVTRVAVAIVVLLIVAVVVVITLVVAVVLVVSLVVVVVVGGRERGKGGRMFVVEADRAAGLCRFLLVPAGLWRPAALTVSQAL